MIRVIITSLKPKSVRNKMEKMDGYLPSVMCLSLDLKNYNQRRLTTNNYFLGVV